MPETQVVTPNTQTPDNSKVQSSAQPDAVTANQTNQPVEDIVVRASKFKIEQPKPKEQQQQPLFDYSKLDSIKTPEEAKVWAENAYKELQRGYNTKYQDLATIKKTYEAKMSEIQSNSKWTPERVQSLLNDNEFVTSAKAILGNNEEANEESYLSESDKKRIQEAQLTAKQALEYQANLIREKEHDSLKMKYANYDSSVVETIRKDLLAGRVNATSEYLWKVYDYENAVQRAYELGKQDATTQTQEKVNASSFDGFNVTSSNEPLKQNQGESEQSYFRRLFNHNLQRMKEVQPTRK